jgi:cytochrome c556
MAFRRIALVAFVMTSCSTAGERPPHGAAREPWAAPTRLAPPADLPGPARQVLRTVMAEHRRDMADLITSMMAVDYDAVATASDRLRADSFSRPLTGDANELNAFLPAPFFELQDQLLAQTRTLGTAARHHSAPDAAKAYAAVSETCVACHAVYREGRRPSPPAMTSARMR